MKYIISIALAITLSTGLMYSVGCCFVKKIVGKQEIIYKATVDNETECNNFQIGDLGVAAYIDLDQTPWKKCADFCNYSGWLITRSGAGATPEISLKKADERPESEKSTTEESEKTTERAGAGA